MTKNLRCKRRAGKLDFSKLEDRMLLTAGNGLQAQYFSDAMLGQVDLVRVDPGVNFNWGSGSYTSNGNNNSFSVRWSGQVEAQFTETYSFILNANDGAKLWVNGHLLVDRFEDALVNDATADIDLIAGRRYDIQMEFRENTGAANVSLEWSSASLNRQVIPTDRLYAADRGSVTLERWTGITGNNVSSLTSNADYPANPDSVSTRTSLQSANNNGNNFGERLRGFIHAPETGPYTFYISADQSAEFRLSTGDDTSHLETIANVSSATGQLDWFQNAEQKSQTVYLVAGQRYAFEALHKEGTGADHLAVGWVRPGTSNVEVISSENLSPAVPEVRVFTNTPNAAEDSAGPAKFTIVRSGTALNNALTVNYAVTGDATAGFDYQSLPGNITIPAGSASVDLNITAIADSDLEGSESLVVEIQAGTGYEVGFKSERTVYGAIQDDAPALPGGTTVWNGQQLSDFTGFGGNFTTVNDPVYGNVIQANITSQPNHPFAAQLRQNNDAPITAGDILFAEFRVRSVGGDGTISAVFEKASDPYTKSLVQGLPATNDWVKIQIPFQAAESYAVGEASFGFFLGYQVQTIQFTDFVLLNYGQPQSLSPESDFFLNNIGGNYGTSQIVPVTGQSFDVAYEVETQTVPPLHWHLQAVTVNDHAVFNGDTMRIQFSVRATDGATPETDFVVQRTDTYDILFSQGIQLTSSWQNFSFDVDADDDFGPEGLQTVFNLGAELQTVEIGGYLWTNEANAFDLTDLPQRFPAATYTGREALDSWRDSADNRIESERTSAVTVNVNDVNGLPLSGALVSLRQQQHAFLFGSAINAYDGKLDPNGNAQALKYQSEINRLFNTVVFENSLKWPAYLNDAQRAIDGVDWADDNDLFIRGHNIIWPSRDNMPSSVWAEYDSRVSNNGTTAANAWLKTTIENRFDEVLTEFDGQIPEWDIVNEPWANRDVMNIFGDSILIDWFQRVRDFDPDIALTLNDYGIFAANGANTEHRDDFDYWLGLLQDEGLLDVIGEQSHYDDASLTDIEVFGQLVNTYNSEFNAPIAITEFDVNTKNEQLQADYLRDYLTMAFSQAAVTEFVHWGFWENSHWLPDASLYRNDFSIKPNGQAYEDLVFGRWWSDTQNTTRDGYVVSNVFEGDYDVVVFYEGVEYNATVTVGDSGNPSVTLNLPVESTNHDPFIASDNNFISGIVSTSLTNTGTFFEPDGDTVSFTATTGSVTNNNDGTWSWMYSSNQSVANQTVTVTASDSRGGMELTTFTLTVFSDLLDSGISYGNSIWGENAIAPDKSPLLPGQMATAANFSNYSRGLNRVLVDVAGLASDSLTSDDFEFRVGENADPASWLVLDSTTDIPLPTISVSPTGLSTDRIMLSWPNNAIRNSWLQVTVKPTANTGLESATVFYYGHQIADVNGFTNTQGRVGVNIFDMVQTQRNQTQTALIDNRYDITRDGKVNLADLGQIRGNINQNGLLLFTPPTDPPGGRNSGGGDEQKRDDDQSDGDSFGNRNFTDNDNVKSDAFFAGFASADTDLLRALKNPAQPVKHSLDAISTEVPERLLAGEIKSHWFEVEREEVVVASDANDKTDSSKIEDFGDNRSTRMIR